MRIDQKIRNVLDNLINGKSSVDDETKLFRFIDKFQNDKDLWPEHLDEKVEQEYIWSLVKQKIYFSERAGRLRWLSIGWVRYAAVACLLLIMGFAVGYRFYRSSTHEGIYTMSIITGKREYKKVILYDSSIVWMEPESRLEYPDEFGQDDRRIRFSGNAFFEIKHDSNHPFIIKSDGGMSTKVLGTKFNISTCDSASIVTLVMGKVEVGVNGQQVLLYPNMKAIYSPKKKLLKNYIAINAGDYLLRREGKYLYKAEPLINVVHDIERCFDCHIAIDEKLSNCSFYGEFRSDESLDSILSVLAISLDGNVHFKDGTYHLTGPGC